MEAIDKDVKDTDEVELLWRLEWMWVIFKTQIQYYKVNYLGNSKKNTSLTDLSKPTANLDFHPMPSYPLLGKQNKMNCNFRKTYSRIFINREWNV